MINKLNKLQNTLLKISFLFYMTIPSLGLGTNVPLFDQEFIDNYVTNHQNLLYNLTREIDS